MPTIMPETATIARTCRKCGAIILPEDAGGVCGACLLETGLTAIVDAEGSEADLIAASVLMDFGDYELLEEIGRGGQGVVYRARQKSLNRTVALKVIGLGHWATEAHVKRFRLEAEAAARLEHPGIVPIYEVGERDGSCYFSMKFVEGGQLDEVVRHEPMPIRRAVEMMVKLARTVHYAHEHGILHRDIKPGNVLLDTKGDVHLTDFGLAKLVETESAVTNTFDVLGTPSYMAPEQAAGKTRELTATADVYGLGAVFYQLLTGQPPFAGGTTYETIRLVMETEPRRPSLWNRKIDRDLETICLKCLEKDSQKRYQTAEAFAEDLERWLKHEPIRARPSNVFMRTRKWARRNPATAVLVPSLAALVAALGVIFWNVEPGPPPTGIAVLPFENLSGDKENAFFADGIQDDILTKLAKVADLKVISRTSVMQYRGERNTRKIGQALRVSHVLEGSVRKTGGRIHLNAQLIDTRTDNHVWAEQYDRELTDVFAIQNSIAQNIVRQLSSKISLAEKSAMQKKPTQDLEAYELYLRAKALMHSTNTFESDSLETFSDAANLLEKAVARDPHFALAYSLLAEAHLNRYWQPQAVPDALIKAEAALQAAQRLDPDAGETHLAEALFFYWGHRDYDRALEALERAVRLLPNSADVMRLSAQVERRLGRWKEAMRHGVRASELDPKDWMVRDLQILNCLFTGRYVEAHQLADRAIADLPEKADYFRYRKCKAALSAGNLPQARTDSAGLRINSNTCDLLGRVPYWERNYSEAYRVLAAAEPYDRPGVLDSVAYQKALTARAAGDLEKAHSAFLAARRLYMATLNAGTDLENNPDASTPAEIPAAVAKYFPEVLSQLAVVDAGLGRKQEALREAERAVELRPISRDALEGPHVEGNLALVYSWVGERARAIAQLSALVKVARWQPSYGELKFDPVWDELRDDPRFAEILAEAAKPIPLQ
jgi:TolB-like protein/predicted Ser/Thr protein kinase